MRHLEPRLDEVEGVERGGRHHPSGGAGDQVVRQRRPRPLRRLGCGRRHGFCCGGRGGAGLSRFSSGTGWAGAGAAAVAGGGGAGGGDARASRGRGSQPAGSCSRGGSSPTSHARPAVTEIGWLCCGGAYAAAGAGHQARPLPSRILAASRHLGSCCWRVIDVVAAAADPGELNICRPLSSKCFICRPPSWGDRLDWGDSQICGLQQNFWCVRFTLPYSCNSPGVHSFADGYTVLQYSLFLL